MKKMRLLFCVLALFVFSLVSCNQNAGKQSGKDEARGGGIETSDPELKLTFISIVKTEIASEKLKDEVWQEVNVSNEKTTLVNDDVVAKFDYGNETNKEITVNFDKKELAEGKNTIKLSVASKPGEYKAWNHDIVINRAKKETKPDVNFKMVAFEVKVGAAEKDWVSAKKEGEKWSVSVPHSLASINKENVKAYFAWDGITDPAKRKELPFTVKGGFPIALEVGQPKVVEMTVAPDANGVYPEWKGSVTITRRALELKKIKLAGKTFGESKDIKGTELAGGTINLTKDAQSVDISFYSSEEATEEDQDLAAIITTEPELVKEGNNKVWKLNAVDNTLKVKVNNEVKMTINVRRNIADVKSIVVKAISGSTIVPSVSEGGSYSTAEERVSFAVSPKENFEYKAITVKVGAETPVPLNKDATGVYAGQISLKDGDNDIKVSIEDIANVAALNKTISFKINKTASNSSSNDIDEKVKIKKLYIGDGTMDEMGINKFEVIVNPQDPRKFNVDIPKNYSFEKVALIVEGDAQATAAVISEDPQTAGSVVANGSAVFTGTKTYFAVKKAKMKYVFSLTNGDKKENYEITVAFKILRNFKIIVQQPVSDGVIKVYKSEGLPPVRTDFDLIDENGAKVLAVKEGSFVFIELVANDGKKPKRLTVDGENKTKVTTDVPGQTVGAIATFGIEVKKHIMVSGECGD